MNILNLNHVALLVQNVEQSSQFYQEVLGMKEIPGLGTIWLASGDAEIHLLQETEKGRAAKAVGCHSADDLADGHTVHIAFQVDDLTASRRLLEAYHVEIVCGPRPRGNNGEQLYICDPDGYVIELFAIQSRNGVNMDYQGFSSSETKK